MGFPTPGKGGGGVAPSNYLAVANSGQDLAEGLTTLAMEANFDEGTTGAELNADTITVDVTETGIFVVTTNLYVAVTGMAAAPTIDVTSVLAFTTADEGSLAELFAVNGNLWGPTALVDQSRNGVAQLPFTTPPMQLAAGDSFQWEAGLGANPAAGATLAAPGFWSGLCIVRLG